MAASRSREAGFTLLELLISVTLALALSTMALVAFFQIRSLAARAESRMAMHSSAQTVYNELSRQFSSTQQSCAFVARSTASTAGAYPKTGSVTLIFMHGKEDQYDWAWEAGYYPYIQPDNTDLVWEEWKWDEATRTLLSSTSDPRRQFTAPNGFTPAGGIDLSNQSFTILPQPRRWLDATNPERTLNSNMLFPAAGDTTYAQPSLASPADYGDYTDLQRKLTPALAGVSDFTVQLVLHDGSTVDVGPSATSTVVLNGVYVDGRVSSSSSWTPATSTTLLQAQPAFAGSDIARRPKQLRVRFTLTDPKTSRISSRQIRSLRNAGNAAKADQLQQQQDGTAMSQTFSFTFALPGLAPSLP